MSARRVRFPQLSVSMDSLSTHTHTPTVTHTNTHPLPNNNYPPPFAPPHSHIMGVSSALGLSPGTTFLCMLTAGLWFHDFGVLLLKQLWAGTSMAEVKCNDH